VDLTSQARRDLVGDDVEQVEVISGQMLEHDPLHPRLGELAETVGGLLRRAHHPAVGAIAGGA
jgi:hypothetical protein